MTEKKLGKDEREMLRELGKPDDATLVCVSLTTPFFGMVLGDLQPAAGTEIWVKRLGPPESGQRQIFKLVAITEMQ